MKKIKLIVKWGCIVIFVLFLLIQFIPIDRNNPPVESEVPATLEVRSILKRSCYDCHSNETIWPWYSRVAPISWLIVYDVKEGRKELNFSTWNKYTSSDQAKKLNEIGEEVEEGEMPLWIYLPTHPNAKLSPEDRKALQVWSQSTNSNELIKY